MFWNFIIYMVSLCGWKLWILIRSQLIKVYIIIKNGIKSLPYYLPTYTLPTYLPTHYLPTYLPTYTLPTYLHTTYLYTYLPTHYLPTYLPTQYLPTYSLSAYLPIYLHIHYLPTYSLPTYPPTNLSTYVNHSSIHFLSFSIYKYVLLLYVTITMSWTLWINYLLYLYIHRGRIMGAFWLLSSGTCTQSIWITYTNRLDPDRARRSSGQMWIQTAWH